MSNLKSSEFHQSCLNNVLQKKKHKKAQTRFQGLRFGNSATKETVFFFGFKKFPLGTKQVGNQLLPNQQSTESTTLKKILRHQVNQVYAAIVEGS